MQNPSVGRAVHYVSVASGDCRAGIITEVVDGEEVGVVIFNPFGTFYARCDHNEDAKAGGTWHWPEII